MSKFFLPFFYKLPILPRPELEIPILHRLADDVRQVLATDEVSGAGESHPRALSEPYVSVSTHTAPAIRRHGIAPSAQ